MVFSASDTGDLEESSERLGLELIPYKQPSHPGKGRGGGRWSLFPGGFRGEVPPMRVHVCACLHVCTHVCRVYVYCRLARIYWSLLKT